MASLFDLLRMSQPGAGGIGGIAGALGGSGGGGLGGIAGLLGGGMGAAGRGPAYGQIRQGLGGSGQYAPPSWMTNQSARGPDWMAQMGQAVTSTPQALEAGRFRQAFGGDDRDAMATGWRHLFQGYDPTETSQFINGPGGPRALMNQSIAQSQQAGRQWDATNGYHPTQTPQAAQVLGMLGQSGLWGGMQDALTRRRGLYGGD